VLPIVLRTMHTAAPLHMACYSLFDDTGGRSMRNAHDASAGHGSGWPPLPVRVCITYILGHRISKRCCCAPTDGRAWGRTAKYILAPSLLIFRFDTASVMAAYFPPTAYERLPDHAEYGIAPAIPLQQQRPSPQNDQRQRPGPVFSSPTTPTHYFDHDGLLKQQTQYAPPHQPQTSFVPLSHRETAIYTPPAANQLRHQYRRIKQFRRISLGIFGRWLLSCLLAATIVGIFMHYQNMGVLGGNEKHMFNALYLGVSLMYGLNLVVGSGVATKDGGWSRR